MTRIAAALILVLALTAPLATPGQVAAQSPGAAGSFIPSADTVRVELTDGTTLYGRVEEVRGDTVRVTLLSGDELQVLRPRIRSVARFRGRVVKGAVWEPDPNESRLFFGPTGRSLGTGSGYLAMYYAIMPFVAVGAGDRVTLAGGAPLFIGSEGPEIFWLAPKVEVLRTERVRGALGVLSFFDSDGTHGVVYGVATYGRSPDAAVTVGAGYGYAGSDMGETPALLMGGELRGSPSLKLVTENYLFPGEGMLLSAGPRFIGRHLTADLALVAPIFDGLTMVAPFVNFVWNW